MSDRKLRSVDVTAAGIAVAMAAVQASITDDGTALMDTLEAEIASDRRALFEAMLRGCPSCSGRGRIGAPLWAGEGPGKDAACGTCNWLRAFAQREGLL